MEFEFSSEEQVFQYFLEFEATRNSVKRDVEYLKQWMKQEPHLPEVDDDDLLTNFLLRGKNNVEKTKRLIDTYFTARARMPEIFQNRGHQYRSTIEQMGKFAYFFAVPKLTSDGDRLMIFYICEHEKSDKVPDAIELLKSGQMVFDVSLKTDKVRGVTMIYDFENISFAFFKSFFAALKIALTIQSKINPIRYDKIYVVNVPSYAQPLVSFATNFIKKETEKLIIWNKDSKDLCEALPKDCLPEEYGGSLPSYHKLFEYYYDYAKQYYDWFEQQSEVKADLSKKTEDSSEEAFRKMQGTFRKLSID